MRKDFLNHITLLHLILLNLVSDSFYLWFKFAYFMPDLTQENYFAIVCPILLHHLLNKH